MAFEFTDANFSEDALNSNIPVVVDFYADWCGPCKTIAPIIEALSTQYEGKVKIGKMDTGSNQAVPAKYGVMNIPTLLFIKDGEVVETVVGAKPQAILEEKIKNLL
ncbi:MAG: thioredoxin [Epulopiscium sp. Nele67-Bin005]|nr:MAG: thioredoxin [Epulopiscium sp. Nele67-Bin005]